jgi:hypothetical protein
MNEKKTFHLIAQNLRVKKISIFYQKLHHNIDFILE